MSDNKLSERNAAIQAMLSDGNEIGNFYRFAAQNEHINLHDACQIVICRPNASVCFSFEEWNAMGRYITRGRKGIPYYDSDIEKHYVFDANDTHGDNKYQRLIYPIKRLFEGLDELNGLDSSIERNDYQRIYCGVATYLQDSGYLTGDSERNTLIIEGTAYSLYCKTGFPKTSGIDLHGFPYGLRENADLFKEIYVTTDTVKREIESAYIAKQEQVNTIDDTDEDAVSDEPVIPHTEQAAEEPEEQSGEDMSGIDPRYSRYIEVQKAHPESVVAMRLGDFYEVLGEKAKVVANELDLTLTSRDLGLAERVPMIGFPYHATDKYFEKILEKYPLSILENGEEYHYTSRAGTKNDVSQLIETDDEETPFDDEQPDYADGIDTRFPVDDNYDDDEQESEEFDEDEIDEVMSEQDETEDLSTPKSKGKSHPIQERKHKPKPQMSLFDLYNIEEKKPQDILKEEGLKIGSGVSHGKYRIYEEYKTNPDENEYANFLRNEYGTGGGTHRCRETGYEFDNWHDGKGLTLKSKSGGEEVVVKLNWKQVATGIADLIDDDKYFTPEEKEEYKRYYAERHGSDEERIKAIVDDAIAYALKHNKDGAYLLWSSWLYADHLYFAEHSMQIAAELNSRNEVANATFVNDKITILFDREYLLEREQIRQNDSVLKPVKATPTPNKVFNRFTELTAEGKAYFDDYSRGYASEPMMSMWDEVQTCRTIANGIYSVSTTGHGGFMIARHLAPHILSPEALEIGVLDGGYYCFEEDCDESVPIRELTDKGILQRTNGYFSEYYVKSDRPEAQDGRVLFAYATEAERSAFLENWYKSVDESIELWHSEYWKARQKAIGVQTPVQTDEERVKALAAFMVDKGAHETSEGNYNFYFDELPESKEFIYAHAEQIRDELEKYEEVADAEALGDVDGDFFSVNYYLNYCPNLDESVVEDIYGENTDLNEIGFDQSELGGAKSRFKGNMEAIRLLNSLYDEDRLANGVERKTLAHYVGWGGLPQAFDERDASWKNEYEELKSGLSTEDYERAKGSVLNAHYTSKEVINGIYSALARFGVKGNNRILEPAMGTGNFFGYMPQEVRNGAQLYGVELDGITGKIAAKLYPEANIQITGFEQTTFPNDHFDIVLGNVPFGNYGVYDSEYAKQNFLIHDYFIAKSIDKLKPNGLMAIITSSGTMDKLNPTVRRYLAERAELLGAIRLPNDAFKQTANTRVVADILFFRKREERVTAKEEENEWLSIGKTEQGYEVNNYFIRHPEMVLGNFTLDNRMYGALDVTVQSDGRNLSDALSEAVTHLPENIYVNPEHAPERETAAQVDYNIKPMCFKAVNGKVYMRVGSSMVEQTLPKIPKDAYQRIVEMINLRNELRHILQIQSNGCSDEKLQDEQRILNANYDSFVRRYGYLNSQTNTKLFRDDADSALLFACEEMSDDKKTATKADIFSKRTIRPYAAVTSTDDCFEALQISKNERGAVDIYYIEELTGKDYDTVINELGNAVFRNPAAVDPNDKYTGFETAEEYLSGTVVQKLRFAKRYASEHPDMGFERNVAALESVQPEKIKASDIGVRIGASWIDKEYYKRFLYDLLDLPTYYYEEGIQIYYNRHDSSWRIDRTGYIRGYSRMKIDEVYGTARANAYRLFEDCLNLRATTIYDTVHDSDGSERRVLNQAETIAAREKQNQIKEAFKDWIFSDPERREELEQVYNAKFNQIRLPAYDGSYLRFPEMNPQIELKPHQKNAVHRIITSGNTLLHHVVGSGKTFTMCAAIMKLRQYGLAKKPMIAVPNHLVQQWANEFRTLYPNAKLLIASKDDLEKDNRQKFVSKVAMGDWDAVIIAQSSFAKIPISRERQERKIREEISRIEETIERAWDEEGMPRGAVKNLEKIKKSREAYLKKLTDDSKKDDVLIFENLGVDYLFIDEAHYYKNKFLFTKMNNVAGISTAASQRASDLEMKCEYINELHDGDKGVVFATGTPISNSMTEMFTMQSYLQQRTLEEIGITYFDSWAADFGETVTSLEMAPSGRGYKPRTRFSKFTNLPELLTLYRSFADVQTSDMVKLDVPEAKRNVITLKPSDTVLELADEIAARAERISNGGVPPEVDNMLKVTSDGKKLALDPRCFERDSTDENGSKINECANRVFEIWEDTQDIKGTQVVFCDLSTPKSAFADYEYGRDFDVYNDLKYKLVQMGIPQEQIAFIHDANSDLQKQALFDKVNAGTVRVLIGSTEKCGAGTNVQERLIALHHLDTPYRPSDMQQREGRIIRQGNSNKEVQIFTYVTERTFDSYSYQILENKQRFIAQIDRGDLTVREAEDIDETTLTYAEIKAITAANPKIKRKMEVDTEISRLRVLEGQYKKKLYDLQDKVRKTFPEEIKRQTLYLERLKADIATVKSKYNPDEFKISILGKEYTDRKEGGMQLMDALMGSRPDTVVAEFAGFKISLDPLILMTAERSVTLTGEGKYTMGIGQSASGLLTRLDNFFTDFHQREERAENKLHQLESDFEVAKLQLEKPFEHRERLNELVKEQGELNAELDLNRREEVVIDDQSDEKVENGDGDKGMALPEAEMKTAPKKRNKPRKTVSQEMLNVYKTQKAQKPQSTVFMQNGDYYEVYGDDAQSLADEYGLQLLSDSDLIVGKVLSVNAETMSGLVKNIVDKGGKIKIIEPQTEIKESDILDENDKIEEKMLERKEKLRKFVDAGLSKIKWLNGRNGGFTDDEISDLTNDLKEHFEKSEFYAQESGMPYDEWYDSFAEDELIPILEERKIEAEKVSATPDYELVTKNGYRIENLYSDGERKIAIFHRESDNTYGVAYNYDTETGEWGQGHYDFTTYMSAYVDIPNDKHLSLIFPKNKTRMELVRESVEREYKQFYDEEMQKPKEDLINADNYKIRFYNELSVFLGENIRDNLTDRDFEALYYDSPFILSELYDYYLGSEYASINNYGDTADMIKDYNDEYHESIVSDRYEFVEGEERQFEFYGKDTADIGYYYFRDSLSIDHLDRIADSASSYVIAAPVCYMSETQLDKYNISFLKTDRDILEPALRDKKFAITNMQTAIHNVVAEKAREYRENLKNLTACKNAIEKGISENFDGMHLKADFENQIIAEFGEDRVHYVLANTVQLKDYDGRFSRDNKTWAQQFEIKENEGHRNNFLVDSHPAVLDAFINRIRKKENEKIKNVEEGNTLPENEKSKWVEVTVSRDALIKTYDKHSFLRMPNGYYQEYGYNVFNDRIKKSTMLTDLQSDSRELAYALRFREDETVTIKHKTDGDIEFSVNEFKELVGGKGGEAYIRKDDENETRWTTIRVPQNAVVKNYENSALFTLPQTSDLKGYSFYVPNVFISEDKEKDDGTIKISVPDDFKFTVKDKDKKELKLSAYQMYQRMNGTEASQYAVEKSAQPQAQSAPSETSEDWHYVSVDKAAKITEYDERTMFRMPKGDYEGYCYFIPNRLLRENEEKGTIRISLPDDFIVFVLNSQAEKEEEQKIEMSTEQFIGQVKGKAADDYPTYRKPSESKTDKFTEVEQKLIKAVPDEMKKKTNWVIVRTRMNEEKGRLDKFLISPITGKFAESDNPETWSDFDTACAYAKENGGVALAYALDGKDGIACIDLDGCIEANGDFSPLANEVFNCSDGMYCEKSVSGSGLHFFGKTQGMDIRTFSKDGDLEFYQSAHFIAMTGDDYGSTELKSFDTPKMKALLERKCEKRVAWNGTGAGVEGLSRMSDRDVVDKAEKSKNGEIFKAYYNGKDLKNNHSNSDMAFMNMLAFWCNGDKEQMLRIFATSGLYRADKSPSYYECTVIKAIKDTTERFQPKEKPVSNKPVGNGSSGKGGK